MSVAVPEAAGMEVGLSVALRPDDGDTVSITVPENPFVGATVIVDVPLTLGFTGPMDVGLAFTVKSGVGALTTNFPTI